MRGHAAFVLPFTEPRLIAFSSIYQLPLNLEGFRRRRTMQHGKNVWRQSVNDVFSVLSCEGLVSVLVFFFFLFPLSSSPSATAAPSSSRVHGACLRLSSSTFAPLRIPSFLSISIHISFIR
ncbi:hypothetical protein K438DRAFT_1880263 [Mycena galopus ATCC 62051]|nr:hypothetical protein K438DRAFT_1880263 [Mycena galopus ATCC 62051]